MDAVGLEAFDHCVSDACEFLEIGRRDFFSLAQRWPEFARTILDWPEDPGAWYSTWVGVRGRSNVCLNIIDQFSRPHIVALLKKLPGLVSQAKPHPLAFADVGCGSAAVSFEIARHFSTAYLIDVPNLPQEFVTWRCRRNQLGHIATGTVDDIASPVDVMMCIDVLEHIAASTDFFVSMTRFLKPGGLLFMQAPWYSVNPNDEHLPEAEEDWNKPGGGRDLLGAGYTRLERWPDGGVYQKQQRGAVA